MSLHGQIVNLSLSRFCSKPPPLLQGLEEWSMFLVEPTLASPDTPHATPQTLPHSLDRPFLTHASPEYPPPLPCLVSTFSPFKTAQLSPPSRSPSLKVCVPIVMQNCSLPGSPTRLAAPESWEQVPSISVRGSLPDIWQALTEEGFNQTELFRVNLRIKRMVS